MNTKQPTISDIQTREILFYDPAFEKESYAFCKDRNIDCLPSLDDPFAIFLRDDQKQTFREKRIDESRRISGAIPIFRSELLGRFHVQPLLLVYENDELSGVVHFADYGKPLVSLYLFELFFEYEKALRELLRRHKFKDEDIIAYFDSKGYGKKIKDYRNLTSKEKRPDFESFNIKDMVDFINEKELYKVGDVRELRNMIMHAHDLVNREDPDRNDYIYKYDSFEEFFNWVVTLHQDYRRLTNRLAFPIESEQSKAS